LYKVLTKDMLSPYQKFKYDLNKKYVCENFDTDVTKDCSRGFYATDIDGLIYSFNIKQRVFECEIGGRKVEFDQFKRRYETIKLIREVPHEEVKGLAKKEENKVGYKLSEALFPINPLKIGREEVTKEDIKLLEEWVLVRNSVNNSVWYSINNLASDSAWKSLRGLLINSVGDLVWYSVWYLIKNSVGDSVGDSVWNSARDSITDVIYAYISSLFPNIKYEKGKNPFQPGIDLWRRGLVPSFDSEIWRLHGGKKAEIVYEM
jgi:hypothetical protein